MKTVAKYKRMSRLNQIQIGILIFGEVFLKIALIIGVVATAYFWFAFVWEAADPILTGASLLVALGVVLSFVYWVCELWINKLKD